MSNPIVPNYVPGVGRLVTDRFDFQNHIDGYSFRHVADQIDLSPAVVVDGYTVNNVQEAITTISGALVPPVIADATTSSKGIVQLNGDVSGTATNLTVIGLQNFPVSSLSPNDGQSLTWVQTNNNWEPVTINSFTAAGDLSGTSTNQTVVGLTGSSGNVTISADNLKFTELATPLITQDINTSSNGTDLKIIAQGTNSTNSDGGNIIISGGEKDGTGLGGGTILSTDNEANPLVQLIELSGNRRVVSLANDQILDNIQMQNNTGDRVIYIRDADTVPTASPVGGAILYSNSGKLNIKQEDGTDFIIGSIPNPSIWGSSGQQVYTSKDYVTSLSGNYATAFTYNVTANTSVKLDVIFVGRVPASFGVNEGYSANMAATFIVSAAGTALSSSGGPYTSNISSLGAGWNAPNIGAFVGSTISVRTPYSNTRPVRWLVITQVTIVG